MQIRLLNKDEIECRVSQVAKDLSWCSVLLYKDARVDMRILDETFGPMNWQRSHEVVNGNLFCTVSVWDEEKGQWIKKQDVGVESKTEAEKGQASDSFKRACFNLGIGRELYTAPQIFIRLNTGDIANNKVKTRFHLTKIEYTDGCISALEVVDGKGEVRYSYPEKKANKKDVFKMIESAQSVNELTQIFNQNPSLHGDQQFLSALTQRKTQVA